MAFEFKLPDIGEGLVEGEIVKWLVKEGDTVQEDQPIVEVMTDKATVEISSPRDGVILKLAYKEGDTVAVDAPFVIIAEPTETKTAKRATPKLKAVKSAPAKASATAAKPSAPPLRSQPSLQTRARSEASAMILPPLPNHRVLAAPAVRKFARQSGVDLNTIQGSGPYGRVLRSDVEQVQGGSAVAAAVAVGPGHYETRGGATREVPLRGLRKRIAAHMVHAKQHAPHFTYVEELDMSAVVKLRRELKAEMEKRDINLTYLPFIFKALVPALKEFPQVNATLDDVRNVIILKQYYNFGIAVATEDGLIVPVIKNVDQLDLWQLARESRRLAEAARNKRIKSEELQDGTFTLTSIGNLGGVLATPIINYPEVAIMGVNKVRDTAVVRDGEIVIRPMLYLSTSFDHRVVDGDVAARFTNAVIAQLQNPKQFI